MKTLTIIYDNREFNRLQKVKLQTTKTWKDIIDMGIRELAKRLK